MSIGKNKYTELSHQNLSSSYQESTLIPETDRRIIENENFWLKNDFLNLKFYVKFGILKTYYMVFYLTLAFFFLVMVGVFFPVDWSDNTNVNALMTRIDQWIKAKDVE